MVTTNDARNMRNDLMDFLFERANILAINLRVWEDLDIKHASDMENELHMREISHHAQIYTLKEYFR